MPHHAFVPTVPPAATTAGAGATGPYRLARPTLHDAYSAVYGLYGPHTADIWRTLLHSAGLTGEETAPSALDRLVVVMQADQPLIRICGRSLQVRVTAYEQLARAHASSAGQPP